VKEFDSLSQLWQQQAPVQVDATLVLKAYQKERVKQWLFAGLDILGLMVVPVLFLWLHSDLSQAEILWFAIMGGVAFVFTVYALWLRRLLLLRVADKTHLYITILRQQTVHQVTLAKCTKWMTVFMGGMFTWLVLGIANTSAPHTSYLEKLLVLLVTGVILLGIWFWANNRQAFFHAKLNNANLWNE